MAEKPQKIEEITSTLGAVVSKLNELDNELTYITGRLSRNEREYTVLRESTVQALNALYAELKKLKPKEEIIDGDSDGESGTDNK